MASRAEGYAVAVREAAQGEVLAAFGAARAVVESTAPATIPDHSHT